MKILDIGANNGNYAKTICKNNSDAVIVSVEPNPNQPTENIQGYNITWESKAVSDINGQQATLHLSVADTLHTLNQNWLKFGRFTNYATNSSITVETITIDSLWEKYGGFDHIKMDVEGYENIAIRGLTKYHPNCSIQFEWASEWVPSVTLPVLEYLSNLGYSKFNIKWGEDGYDFDPFNLPSTYMNVGDILDIIPKLIQKRSDAWGMILAQ